MTTLCSWRPFFPLKAQSAESGTKKHNWSHECVRLSGCVLQSEHAYFYTARMAYQCLFRLLIGFRRCFTVSKQCMAHVSTRSSIQQLDIAYTLVYRATERTQLADINLVPACLAICVLYPSGRSYRWFWFPYIGVAKHIHRLWVLVMSRVICSTFSKHASINNGASINMFMWTSTTLQETLACRSQVFWHCQHLFNVVSNT